MIGSLYAGVGGLDLAAEHVLGMRTAWQLDLTGAEVRSRHWPATVQVTADVATVDPLALPRVSVLVGGFACQDLSTAGLGRGLIDGDKTGPTYRHLVRFTEALSPDLVIMENVPALLSKWRAHLEEDWHRMGYGLTWVRCGAWDAGAPHIRRRVFVVAERGGRGGGVLDAPTGGRWSGEGQTWPTPTAGDAKASGYASWAARAARVAVTSRPVSEPLAIQTRPWPTPAARDYKVGSGLDRVGTPPLSEAAVPPAGSPGRRLNADWVECLQGLPQGWTETTGPRLDADLDAHRWPRGRYPEGWDRTQPWPGFDWEPSRTLPDGDPVPGRPARLRALGNAVCPQQGALAIRTALDAGHAWRAA